MFVVYWCGCVCVCLCMHRLPPKREWVPILRSSSVSRKYLLLRLFLVVFSSCHKDDKGVFPCLRANTSGISKRCMRECANSLTKIVWFFVWTPQPTPLPLPNRKNKHPLLSPISSYPIHSLIQTSSNPKDTHTYVQSRYPQTVEKETINEIANKHTHKHFFSI